MDSAAAGEPRPGRLRRSLRVVGEDYEALLQPRRLLWLGGGLAAGGALANSDLEAELYADYRDWSAERDLADWASVGKGMGEAEVVLPLFPDERKPSDS